MCNERSIYDVCHTLTNMDKSDEAQPMKYTKTQNVYTIAAIYFI